MALFPTFPLTGGLPRNQPNTTFFPSTTTDGFATTVANAVAPYLQAAVGTQIALPVAYKKPIFYTQTLRVYSPSRRMFPKAF